jgi:hypothetical protein
MVWVRARKTLVGVWFENIRFEEFQELLVIETSSFSDNLTFFLCFIKENPIFSLSFSLFLEEIQMSPL